MAPIKKEKLYNRTIHNEECRPEDLNPQPTDYKSVALPIELGRHNISPTSLKFKGFKQKICKIVEK